MSSRVRNIFLAECVMFKLDIYIFFKLDADIAFPHGYITYGTNIFTFFHTAIGSTIPYSVYYNS